MSATSEHDELLLSLRQKRGEYHALYDRFEEDKKRLAAEVTELESHIHGLRAGLGLSYHCNPIALPTDAERAAGLDAPVAYWGLGIDPDDPQWKVVLGICDRDYVMSEIVSSVEDLAKFLSDPNPDRERVNRLYWALTDATTAMQHALKPIADPID